MKSNKKKESALTGVGCLGVGCSLWIGVIILNLTLGAYCFAFSLDFLFGKSVDTSWNVISGLFLGELTIPVAVICWILKLAGVSNPVFH